ncbi:hypothetical protein Clacol_009654 [Clathrus columnatus]|uniref:Major facilitator superfamily (MFS) profile domain-containing protein n=1 Tax=Clathrus columnatus TaxID=1419009 RepID=A0AAV5APE6_9AGAM|nr:hypothetical protein Clacol_009654 [Clathrus columnatus]
MAQFRADSEVNIPLNSSRTTIDSDGSSHLLSGPRLILVTIAFILMTSLSGLDITIVATTLVTITSHFNAVSDIAWITSAFFIVQTSFILLYGKFLNIAPPKVVLLAAAGVFELGSLFCAIAPSIDFLIFGRAICGLGATGLWVSILAIIGRISTVRQRPILIGLMASAHGFASIVGPVVGGTLSGNTAFILYSKVRASYAEDTLERVSWRWCFYINLPLGGTAFLLLFILLPNLPSLVERRHSILQTWLALDWIGAFLNILGVFLFLTGIQWGGNTRPWNDPGVILTIVIAFMQWALVLTTTVMTVGGAISGGAVALTGQVWIWLFFPPFLGTIAFGFLVVSNIDTSFAQLIGYQILIGFGLGASVQNCFIMAQVEYADQEDLVPQATSLVTFSGLGFSALGLAISGTVFSQVLHSQVAKLNLNLPESLRSLVLENIDAVLALPEDLKVPLIKAYITAVNRIFISGVVITTLGGLSALLVERKSISLKSLSGGAKSYPSRRSIKRSSKYYDEIYRSYRAEPYIPLI